MGGVRFKGSAMRWARSCFLLLALALSPQLKAGDLDLGLGLAFIDSSGGDALDLGWDLQLGYEFWQQEAWNIGLQLQLTRGITAESEVDDENDLYYSSNALYLTARPENWWLHFKAGVVQADYRMMTTGGSHTGYGLGAGLVIGSDNFRVHLLDYQRVRLGSESFDLYTISIAVLAH